MPKSNSVNFKESDSTRITQAKPRMLVNLTGLRTSITKWFFPGLVVVMVVGNQLWMLGPFYIGQMMSWALDLAAAVVVLATFRRKFWTLVLIACIVLAKIFAIGFQMAEMETAYFIFLNMLFCAAGAVIASKSSNLVYKQLMIICLINVFFMIMQAVGVGGWTQFLTTATSDAMSQIPVPTLFVKEEDLMFSFLQGRPCGLLHSNNFLSLIVLFGLALHLSCKNNRFGSGMLIICMIAVLSMAKIVFLGFILMVLWLLVMGCNRQRLRVLRVLALTAILAGIYALFFPGLFTVQTGLDHIGVSFFIRLNDIVQSFPSGSFLRQTLEPYLVGTPRAVWAGTDHVSGYVRLIPMLPYLIVAMPILTYLYRRGYRMLRIRFPHLTDTTALTLLVVCIYPGAVPFWDAQIYWFIAGFALLPLFILILPQYFKGVQSAPPRLTRPN